MPASPGYIDTKFEATKNDDSIIYDYADGTDIRETTMDPSLHVTFKQDPLPVGCSTAISSTKPAQASAESDYLASYESAEVHQNPGSLNNRFEGCAPSSEPFPTIR